MNCALCGKPNSPKRMVFSGFNHSLTDPFPNGATYREWPVCDRCWLDPSRYRGGVDDTSQRIARFAMKEMSDAAA